MYIFIMITQRIVAILLFIVTFTMVIHAFSFPVYAQRFSIDFPEDGVVNPPFTDPQSGITNTMFNFYNPGRFSSFSFEDFDDATITIIFFPNTFYASEEDYDLGSLCEETFDRVIINTIDYSKINAK